jgi:hypothetical protein
MREKRQRLCSVIVVREFAGRLPPVLRLALWFLAPYRLAFDGDFVVAEGEKAEQEGPAGLAENGA